MEETFLIVGLGNPGKDYAATRHNVGFMVINRLAKRLGVEWEASKKFTARLAKGRQDGNTVFLSKPQGFMNLSGQSVAPLAQYYQIPNGRVMVVVDDLDLPPGTIRIRGQGSSGGQKGLEDIISALGTQKVARCRIGIGRPEAGQDVSEHVLERPEGPQKHDLERSLARATESVLCWLVEGVMNAARRYNGPLPEPEIEIPEGLNDVGLTDTGTEQ